MGLLPSPARADEALARCIAATPFGAGQFQSGDTGLGILFAAGEVGLGGASIATMLFVNHLASVSPSAHGHQAVDVPALNRQLATVVAANRVAFAGWAALTAAGILEAEVTFAPRRAAPADTKRPPISATLAATPGGGFLGLRTTF